MVIQREESNSIFGGLDTCICHLIGEKRTGLVNPKSQCVLVLVPWKGDFAFMHLFAVLLPRSHISLIPNHRIPEMRGV
jgi:hypothetical protein